MSYQRTSGSKATGITDRTKAIKQHEEKRSKDARMTGFMSFYNKRVKALMQTWDTVSHLYVGGLKPAIGHGFNGHTYHENLLQAEYEKFHTSGNMKEAVSAQLAGFKTLSSNMFHLMSCLASQLNIRTLLENPTMSDAQTLDYSAATPRLPLNEVDTFNTFVGILEDEGVPVPDYIVPILKMTSCIRIKMADQYSLYDADIPDCWFVPIIPTAIISTLKTSYWRNGAAAPYDGVDGNQGIAKLHMDKFGMKYTPFNKSMIEPVEVRFDDPIGLAWLQNYYLTYSEGGGVTEPIYPDGNFGSAVGFTEHDYFWKGDKPTCDLFKIINLLFPYAATYNIYGNMFVPHDGKDTEGYLNMIKWAFTGATPEHVKLVTPTASDLRFLFMFAAFWNGSNTANELDVNIDGTKLTTELDGDGEYWPLWQNHDLWKSAEAKSPAYDTMKEFNLKFIATKLYGQ